MSSWVAAAGFGTGRQARGALVVALAAVVFALTAHPALAKRLALVIGNSAYVSGGPLLNPGRDADAFSGFLLAHGFAVTEVKDATRADMSRAVAAFVSALRPEDEALFYYSGHGMQMDGENYLLGIEAELNSTFDVPGVAIELNRLIATLEDRARLSLIFIDACRNNPLADALVSTRAITRGLAPVQTQGDGTMIAFAAAPGQVAFDGIGDNSPFTEALITHLGEPGIEVGTAFKRVIRDVRTATAEKQSPQVVSSLAIEFYFRDEPPVAAPPQPEAIAITVPFLPPQQQAPPSPPATDDTLRVALAEAAEALSARKYADAAIALSRAVALNDPGAMGDLGYLYSEGMGVARDPARAVALLQSAVEGGNSLAAYNLGWSYERGTGVARDSARAAQYLLIALALADAAHAETQRTLPAIIVQDAAALGADTRMAIQRELAVRGLYAAEIDGALGPATRRALEALLPGAEE